MSLLLNVPCLQIRAVLRAISSLCHSSFLLSPRCWGNYINLPWTGRHGPMVYGREFVFGCSLLLLLLLIYLLMMVMMTWQRWGRYAQNKSITAWCWRWWWILGCSIGCIIIPHIFALWCQLAIAIEHIENIHQLIFLPGNSLHVVIEKSSIPLPIWFDTCIEIY